MVCLTRAAINVGAMDSFSSMFINAPRLSEFQPGGSGR
jgi:hypothetical protein